MFTSCTLYLKRGFNDRFTSPIFLNLRDSFGLVVSNTKCHNAMSVDLSCKEGEFEDRNVLLLGDSHAATIAQSLYNISIDKGYAYKQITYGGCTSINTVIRFNESLLGREEDERCTKVSDDVSEYLEKPDSPRYTIVYMSRLPLYLSGERFNNTLGEG